VCVCLCVGFDFFYLSPHRSPHRSLLLPAPLHQQPQAEDGSPIRDLSDHASTSLPLPAAAVPSQRAAWPLLPAPIPSQAVSRDGEGVDTESMAQAEAAGASPVSTVNGGRAVGGGEGGSGAGGHGLPHECLNYGYYAKFFHSVRRIGTGAYGSVYECRHVMDGVDLGRYAVKVCAVGDNRQWLRRVLGEVHNLQALQHENVVRYMHSWLEPFQSSPFSPLVPSLFILMNLANAGNLHSRLALDLPAHRRPCFSDDVIVQDMVDLMRGLEYLHSMRIIHRDLKPENVLVHQETPLQHSGTGGGARSHRLIISDLGQSQRFSSSAASRRTGCTGTVRFTAPEMLEECDLDGIIGNGGYSMRRQFVTSEWTYAADVWSLGAILYCLCFSAVPWEETEDLDDLATLIIQGGGVPRAAGGLSRSSSLMHLVDRTLTQDPAARPSLSALLNTPVIQQAIMVRRGSAAAAGLGENDDAAQGCQGQGSRVRRVPSELNLDSPLVRACVGAGGEAGSGGRGTAGNAGNAGTGVGALVTSALAASSRACAKGRAAAGGCDAQGRSEVGGYAVQQAQGASPLAPLAAVGRQRGGVEGEAGEVHVVRQNHQHRRSKPAATVVEDGFHRSILAVGRVRGAGGAGGLENRTPVRLLLMIVAFVVRGLMEGCLGAAHLAACLLDRLEDPRRQPQSQMSENEGLEDE
jgi:serine/threonine protein kinase